MEISAIKNQLRKQYKQIREQLTIEQVKKTARKLLTDYFRHPSGKTAAQLCYIYRFKMK